MNIREAFQASPTAPAAPAEATPAAAASPPPPPAQPTIPATCPAGALQYPISLNITPTETLYDQNEDPIALEFQWQSRATPPRFQGGGSSGTRYLTDETNAGLPQTTSVRFLTLNYALESVQIVKAETTNWILPPPPTPTAHVADIVLTFQNLDVGVSFNYLMFVIPMIQTNQVGTVPPYLAGLADQLTQGPFSLEGLFPTNPATRFAYVSACIAGSPGNPYRNALMFINTDGLKVTEALFTDLKRAIGAGDLIRYDFPFGQTLLRPSSGSSLTATNFSTHVKTTRTLLDPGALKGAYRANQFVREDDLSAYKCVPFDPEVNVQDGKIRVNVEKGGSLVNVLEERETLKEEVLGKDPGKMEKFLSNWGGIFVTAILSIIGAGILLFVIMNRRSLFGSSTTAGAAGTVANPNPSVFENFMELVNNPFAKYTLFGLFTLVIGGLMGFIIGLFAS